MSTSISPRVRPLNLMPRFLPLEEGIGAAQFECMKRVPAWHILECALADGVLEPGGHVAETTSGTFGLGLAEACRALGLSCSLVTDPAMDDALRHRIESLGAVVHVVSTPAAGGNYQRARMARLDALVRSLPGTFVPRQYHNHANHEAYGPVAAWIIEHMGMVDWLVAAVGSGGSSRGLAGYLRKVHPGLRVAGVDTHGSVLFGQPDGKRLLRGLGNSIHPANVQHSAFDRVVWTSAGLAFHAARALHREHLVFAGPTSGAVYLTARWLAATQPGSRVAAVFPDTGHRYATTVFDPAWIASQGLTLDGPFPSAPVEASTPLSLHPDWAWFPWGRRTFEEVTGAPWSPEEEG